MSDEPRTYYSKPVALQQSDKIRNLHRLAEIQEAQQSVDTLEADLKAALEPVLAKHGLKARDMSIDLSLRAGKMPSFGGTQSPDGFMSCSLDVVNG